MSLLSQPHHDPSERWVSDPRPGPGDGVELTVDVPAAAGVDRVMLRFMHDGEGRWADGTAEATPSGSVWRFELPCHNAVVNYRFWLRGSRGSSWLNGTGVVDHDVTDHHDFRLLTTGGTPGWVPETVWYQIFPDRFATSGRHASALPGWAWASGWDDPVAAGPRAMTQIYGGDLDGITERLSHLVDLGVGGIYLTPVFPARSNHRYDATTFDHVDPILGGDEALVRLREACHRSGLRLLTDLTLNHTGDAHEWFLAAQADAASEEASYYYFLEHPDRYESWLGVRSLPKLDHAAASLRRRFYDGADSVVGRYLREPFGVDGWRIDVANMTGRFGRHDHNAEVRRLTRRTLDSIDAERWLLAEHFFDTSHDLEDLDGGWHGVMNYAGVARPIASWLGTSEALARMFPGPGQDRRRGRAVAAAIDTVRASMPWQAVVGSMALLGSHDTARWRTIARTDELATVGFGMLLGMPGSPCLFYGDEVGLRADDSEQARSPMPWDPSRWDESVHAAYRSLIAIRRTSRALAHGGFRWVEVGDDALTFLRESSDERMLVRVTSAAAPPLDAPEIDLRGAELLFGPGVTDAVAGPSVSYLRVPA